jgi:hypothetical protein
MPNKEYYVADESLINELVYTDHDRTTEDIYASYTEDLNDESIELPEYSDTWPPF